MPETPLNTGKTAAILYLSGFAEVVGGGQRSFLLLLRNLDRARFTPVVLCPAEGEVSRSVSAMGIKTVFLPQPELKTWRLWELFFYAAALRRAVKASGAGLVHCDTLTSAILAGLAELFGGVPVVFHARVSDSGGIKDLLARILCGRIICVSRSVARRFGGSGRVRVIYNGVDTGEYNPALDGLEQRARWGVRPGVPLLGYCGQLMERKGLAVLIEAFAAVRKTIPEAMLVIAGRGDFEDKIRGEIRRRGLEGAVVFAGFLENTSLFMAALDVLVLPSFWLEGLSRVLIEAMACGKPVLATTAGGNPETLVDGETGFLFPPGDAAALAQKAVLLLSDRALAEAMGKNARRLVEERFDSRKTSGEVHALYGQVLSGS